MTADSKTSVTRILRAVRAIKAAAGKARGDRVTSQPVQVKESGRGSKTTHRPSSLLSVRVKNARAKR